VCSIEVFYCLHCLICAIFSFKHENRFVLGLVLFGRLGDFTRLDCGYACMSDLIYGCLRDGVFAFGLVLCFFGGDFSRVGFCLFVWIGVFTVFLSVVEVGIVGDTCGVKLCVHSLGCVCTFQEGGI